MITLTRFHSALRSGGSLFEVIIAIGLLAIFASTIFVAIGSQYLATTGTHQSLTALSMAGEGLEAARSIRDTDWVSLTTGAHGVTLSTTSSWSFQSASDSSGGFTRVITITDLSTNEKQIVSRVSWLNAQGQPRSTSLATNVSNWRNVAPPPLLSGDWGNPQTVSVLDIGLDIVGTGVRARNGLVYLSGTAGTASLKDFFVVDVSDSVNPTNVASIHTGPGLNALDVNGNFAYVANNASTNQLQVINISTPSSPYAIKNFTLTGNNHVALSIAVTGTTVLVGTASDSGQELFIVDVSNPTVPLIKSKVEIGGNVNRISILGNRAFLATSNTSKEFMVINITNPNVPVISAQINLPGSNVAKSVYVNPQDSRAYIMRAKSTSSPSPEINIYNVTNPDAPALLGSKELSGNIYTSFAADNLLFMGTDQSGLGIQIFDISSLPTITLYSSLNPAIVNDIAFENNNLYGTLQGPIEELVVFTSF